jgi:hypothetical protein
MDRNVATTVPPGTSARGRGHQTMSWMIAQCSVCVDQLAVHPCIARAHVDHGGSSLCSLCCSQVAETKGLSRCKSCRGACVCTLGQLGIAPHSQRVQCSDDEADEAEDLIEQTRTRASASGSRERGSRGRHAPQDGSCCLLLYRARAGTHTDIR